MKWITGTSNEVDHRHIMDKQCGAIWQRPMCILILEVDRTKTHQPIEEKKHKNKPICVVTLTKHSYSIILFIYGLRTTMNSS